MVSDGSYKRMDTIQEFTINENNRKQQENNGLIPLKEDKFSNYTISQNENEKYRYSIHSSPTIPYIDLLDAIPPPSENSFEARRIRVQSIIDAPCRDLYIPKHQRGPDYIIPSEEYRIWNIDGAIKIRPSNEGFYIPSLSVITAFQDSVQQHPTASALAVKRNNKWIRWTYAQYLQDVRIVAKAFIKLGLKPFHGVAMLGFNAPEWNISYFGAIFSGGIALGIYPSSNSEACHYILDDSRSDFVIVENEVQLKKILEVRNRLPYLRLIIQYCGKPNYPDVLSWEELLAIGRSVPEYYLDQRIKGQAINQCCSLTYTSGTTGLPKGVLLSHDMITFCSRLAIETARGLAKGVRLSFLPLNHVAAQIFDVTVPAFLKGEVSFIDAEALKDKMVDYLTEVRPQIFLSVPRIYEKMIEKIRDAEANMGFLKRTIFNCSRKQVLKYVESKTHPDGQTSWTRFLSYKLADQLVIKKVRAKLGFDRCNMFLVGGAPTPLPVHKYFRSLNMTLKELFGLSETFGMVSTEVDLERYQQGSIGSFYKEVNGKIYEPSVDGIGEICTSGRNVFMGYLNQEEETKKAIDKDGWFHTGDQGYLKDGLLYITGRIKEIIITSGGENIAPFPIEERIKQILPIVSNAMLIGDQRKFLSMLITLRTEINLDTLRYTDHLTQTAVAWCRSIGNNATTVRQILDGPDEKVMESIQNGIDEYNRNAISNAHKIQKWTVLPRDFCIPEEEIGPTLKLKRNFISQKYAGVINKFYNYS